LGFEGSWASRKRKKKGGWHLPASFAISEFEAELPLAHEAALMRSGDQRFNLFALLDFTGWRAGYVRFLGGLEAADQALLLDGHFIAPFCFV
jgi:hypothetical protein